MMRDVKTSWCRKRCFISSPQMLMDIVQTAMATGCVLCTLLAITVGVVERFNGD